MKDVQRLRDLPPGIFERVITGALAETDALRQQVDALAEHVMTGQPGDDNGVSAGDVECSSIAPDLSGYPFTVKCTERVGAPQFPRQFVTMPSFTMDPGSFSDDEAMSDAADMLRQQIDDDIVNEIAKCAADEPDAAGDNIEYRRDLVALDKLVASDDGLTMETLPETIEGKAVMSALVESHQQVNSLERQRFDMASLAGERLTALEESQTELTSQGHLLEHERKQRSMAEVREKRLAKHNVDLAESVKSWRQSNEALREDHQAALDAAREEGARYAIEQLRQGVDLTEKQGRQVEALLCAIVKEYRGNA